MNINKKIINKKILEFIILILLLSYYGFFLANKIDLTTADLGRHLKNGALAINFIFNNPFEFNKLLKTNFYSYTYSDYFFINHHWVSGVIFYLIEKSFGFKGLSWFYIILSLVIFVLFFKLAQKNSNFITAALISLLLIPLIAERKEIRPEIFSYFFMALFFWILWHYSKNLISSKWLFILPLTGIIWANFHIYFIFGLFLIGVFLLEEIFILKLKNKNKIKNLSLTFIFTALSFLIQPNGLKGALYPLNIFKEYGYRIVENQPIWFLKKIGIINSNILLFELVFLLMIFSFILLLILNRKNFSFSLFLIGMTFGVMAFLALRNFTLFGFFVLVVLAYNFDKIFKQINFSFEFNKFSKTFILILALVIIDFTIFNSRYEIFNKNKGIGLAFENNASIEFFKNQNIQGPIFNNYDIGSYLVYYLFPQEKVFVDNRPEAYPASFFQKIYIPMQENENVWKKQDEKYNFNVIFFSYRDYTPWSQEFLINRIKDSNWAPVFADKYVIIFLKRNNLNKDIIQKYEIPKDFFKITVSK
ncbi:MAG: hypothetical protein ACP5QN_01010 [Minisyncoccia bacterium]